MSHPVPISVSEFGELNFAEPRDAWELSGDGVFCALFSTRSACLSKALDGEAVTRDLVHQLVAHFGANSDLWVVGDLETERHFVSSGGDLTPPDIAPFQFKLQVVNRFPFDELTRNVHKAVFDTDYRLLLPPSLELIGADMIIGQNGLISFSFNGFLESGWNTGAMNSLFGADDQRKALAHALEVQAAEMTSEAIRCFAEFSKARRDQSMAGKVVRQKIEPDAPSFGNVHFVLGGKIESNVDLGISTETPYTEFEGGGNFAAERRATVTSSEALLVGPTLTFVGTKLDLATRLLKVAFVVRTVHTLFLRYADACAQADRLYHSEKDLAANDLAKLTKGLTISYLRLTAPYGAGNTDAEAIRRAILTQWDLRATMERSDFLVSALEARAQRRRAHQQKEFQVAVQGLLMIMLLLALVGGFADMRILGWPN